jgi:quercetin dioxygenase-like cupin family protein
MEQREKQQIRIGDLEVNYIADPRTTGGALDMFEFVVPAKARVPVPHFHKEVDEVIYVLAGTLTITVDEVRRELNAGDSCIVPRGAVHHFVNQHPETVRALSVQTPGSIGPAYYREMAAAFTGGAPDPKILGGIMLKHGLVPVPPKPAAAA